MKKIFTAGKGSYGSGFFTICDSLDELKKAIVSEYYQFGIHPEDDVISIIDKDLTKSIKEDEYLSRRIEYSDDMYSEELFLHVKKDGRFTLYEIDLHDEEEIQFDEYDGQSWFSIEKKEPNILSKLKYVE
jgi:hypothetical protein